MQGHNLSIQASTLWPNSNTTGLHKATEASSWLPTAEGGENDHLPGRHSYPSLRLGYLSRPSLPDLSIARGTGLLDKQKEVPDEPNSADRVPGFSVMLPYSESPYSSREAEEDSPGGIPPTPTDNSTDKRPGKVYREDFSICQGNQSCTSTLQGLTEAHECRPVTIGGEV